MKPNQETNEREPEEKEEATISDKEKKTPATDQPAINATAHSD
jgi:hypothetical protein